MTFNLMLSHPEDTYPLAQHTRIESTEKQNMTVHQSTGGVVITSDLPNLYGPLNFAVYATDSLYATQVTSITENKYDALSIQCISGKAEPDCIMPGSMISAMGAIEATMKDGIDLAAVGLISYAFEAKSLGLNAHSANTKQLNHNVNISEHYNALFNHPVDSATTCSLYPRPFFQAENGIYHQEDTEISIFTPVTLQCFIKKDRIFIQISELGHSEEEPQDSLSINNSVIIQFCSYYQGNGKSAAKEAALNYLKYEYPERYLLLQNTLLLMVGHANSPEYQLIHTNKSLEEYLVGFSSIEQVLQRDSAFDGMDTNETLAKIRRFSFEYETEE